MNSGGHFEISGDVLTRYTGPGGAVVIPEGVTSIGEGAFQGCAGLTSVTIPDGVAHIASHAFKNCSGLTAVFVSSAATRISRDAFLGCRELRKLDGPGPEAEYEGYAFGGCASLVFDTQLPEHAPVRLCGDWRYALLPDQSAMVAGYQGDPDRLPTELDLPEALDGHPVTHLADGAFQDMYALERVTLPGELRAIGARAFARCARLKAVWLHNYADVERFGLSNSLGWVGRGAFEGCASLKRLVLMDRERLFTQDRFYTDTVSLPAHDGIRVKNHALLSGDGRVLLKYPSAVRTRRYVVPSGVTAIAPFAFQYASVSEVVLPPTVLTIGKCAFAGSDLRGIALPPQLKAIEDGTFEGCASLEWVAIPPHVSRIGTDAFCACGKLSRIALPPSLRRLDGCVFRNCEALEEVGLPEDPDRLACGEWNFLGCKSAQIRVPPRCKALNLVSWRGLRRIVITGMDTAVTIAGTSGHRPQSFPTLVVRPGSRAQGDAAELGLPHTVDASIAGQGDGLRENAR